MDELIAVIKAQFTPLAFLCDCKGAHPDCSYTIREDAAAWAQKETVDRITKFMETWANNKENNV